MTNILSGNVDISTVDMLRRIAEYLEMSKQDGVWTVRIVSTEPQGTYMQIDIQFEKRLT